MTWREDVYATTTWTQSVCDNESDSLGCTIEVLYRTALYPFLRTGLAAVTLVIDPHIL